MRPNNYIPGICLLLVFVPALPTIQATTHTLIAADFESYRTGLFDGELLDREFGNHSYSRLNDRASIVEDPDASRGKVLRINYPKGGVGPGETGGQFQVTLPETNELWLSYYVKFEEGFDFRRGGKLPGLTSGGSQYTGGRLPENGEGWSARYMWRKNGYGVIYLYYIDMPGVWGEDLELSGFKFEPGKWHRLTQHIKINSSDNADGILEVWADGKKVLDRHDLRLKLGDQGNIDTFYFSTFHGGNTEDWGPHIDSAARFDSFVISDKKLED